MNDVILVFCDSHGEETNGNVRVGQHVVLNVFHREIMSSIRSDVCALCMCHVCKYKHAPLNCQWLSWLTVVTHTKPVLPGEVFYMNKYSTPIEY